MTVAGIMWTSQRLLRTTTGEKDWDVILSRKVVFIIPSQMGISNLTAIHKQNCHHEGRRYKKISIFYKIKIFFLF